MIGTILSTLKRCNPFRKEYIEIDGSIVPAKDRRYCGPKFKNDRFYLESAEAEATRLFTHFGCNTDSVILDVGSGQGRLPIGLKRVVGDVDYLGIDVDKDSIDWCKKHIEAHHPSFRFKHLDIANERYNNSGTILDEQFRFDLDSKSIDIIYLFSVFSHMYEEYMVIYVKEFLRLLKDDGHVFFTTFVETNVPDFSVNPEGYIFKKCSGPLHVVRYKKNHIFNLLEEIGYSIEGFTHRTETDAQSAFYLKRK